MKQRNRRFALAVVVLGWLSVVSAQKPAATVVNIDPAKTEIHFTVGSLLHTVHGIFQAKSATLMFDPATGAASGEILIDATSGESGNGSRDKKMTKEVLEAQKYPTISFLPKQVIGRVDPTGTSNVQLKGIFRIHGQDHEMTIPVTVQSNAGASQAQMKFDVPYVAWGMKNPSTFVLTVEKIVHIEIESKVTMMTTH
jgi:polyisoprenoid-binding protein YceI